MNPGELAWRLAEARLREARVLLAAGEWSGAFYLGGYAIELALKGRMAVALMLEVLPDPELLRKARVHNLDALASHEWARLDPATKALVGPLGGQWSERSRYLEHTEAQARSFLADVEQAFAAIRALRP